MVQTESPRWLVLQGQEHSAKEVLYYLRGKEHEADAQIHLQLFILQKEADSPSEEADSHHPPSTAGGGAGGSAAAPVKSEYLRILTDPTLRFLLAIGLGLQLAQQFSGVNAVFYYSTSFFTQAHFSDPWLGSVLAAAVNVLATAIAVKIMVFPYDCNCLIAACSLSSSHVWLCLWCGCVCGAGQSGSSHSDSGVSRWYGAFMCATHSHSQSVRGSRLRRCSRRCSHH